MRYPVQVRFTLWIIRRQNDPESIIVGFGDNRQSRLGLGAEAEDKVLTPVAIGDIRVIDNDADGEGKEGKE